MKALLLMAILIMLFTFKSPSQTKLESIKDLIDIMKVDSLASSALRQAFIIQINNRNFAKKDSVLVKNFFNSFKNEELEMKNKLINSDILAIYDRNFTNSEIKDLIIFYRSSAGQKALKLFPNMEMDIWKILKDSYIPVLSDRVDNLEKRIKNK
jgi:uncharacterized protein